MRQLARGKKRLTVKESIFLKEYLANGGNGTKAALKAYDTDDYSSAASIAHETLKKLDNVVQSLMDKKGLTMGKMIDTVNNAMEANKTISAQILIKEDGGVVKKEDEGVIETPDHPTRLKAVQIAEEWVNPKEKDHSNLTQINVYSDKIKKQSETYDL